MTEKCSSLTSFIYFFNYYFFVVAKTAMVEAKLRKCHPAKIKIAKHWLYNTEIVLLIKSIVWLIRLIYLKVYVAPRIIILNYTLSLLKKYRSYWYCFLNNFCCFESIEIRHIQ